MVVMTMGTHTRVETQLMKTPHHNSPHLKPVKFGYNITTFVHICEVCTRYNQVNMKDEDCVDIKYHQLRAKQKFKEKDQVVMAIIFAQCIMSSKQTHIHSPYCINLWARCTCFSNLR